MKGNCWWVAVRFEQAPLAPPALNVAISEFRVYSVDGVLFCRGGVHCVHQVRDAKLLSCLLPSSGDARLSCSCAVVSLSVQLILRWLCLASNRLHQMCGWSVCRADRAMNAASSSRHVIALGTTDVLTQH